MAESLILGQDGGGEHANEATTTLSFDVRLINGHWLRLDLYLVYNTPVHNGQEGPDGGYLWREVDRRDCVRGCEGTVMRARQRAQPKKWQHVEEGERGPAALAGNLASCASRRATRRANRCGPCQAAKQLGRYLYIAFDEANTHVGMRNFRLLASATDLANGRRLGTGCSVPIRVLANNDVPMGSASFSIDLQLSQDWEGWQLSVSEGFAYTSLPADVGMVAGCLPVASARGVTSDAGSHQAGGSPQSNLGTHVKPCAHTCKRARTSLPTRRASSGQSTPGCWMDHGIAEQDASVVRREEDAEHDSVSSPPSHFSYSSGLQQPMCRPGTSDHAAFSSPAEPSLPHNLLEHALASAERQDHEDSMRQAPSLQDPLSLGLALPGPGCPGSLHSLGMIGDPGDHRLGFQGLDLRNAQASQQCHQATGQGAAQARNQDCNGALGRLSTLFADAYTRVPMEMSAPATVAACPTTTSATSAVQPAHIHSAASHAASTPAELPSQHHRPQWCRQSHHTHNRNQASSDLHGLHMLLPLVARAEAILDPASSCYSAWLGAHCRPWHDDTLTTRQ